MKMTSRSPVSSEVVIILSTDSRHSLLEAVQRVFEIVHLIVEYVQGGSFRPNYLSEVMGLKTRLGLYRKLIYNQGSYLGLFLSQHPPETVNHVKI